MPTLFSLRAFKIIEEKYWRICLPGYLMPLPCGLDICLSIKPVVKASAFPELGCADPSKPPTRLQRYLVTSVHRPDPRVI